MQKIARLILSFLLLGIASSACAKPQTVAIKIGSDTLICELANTEASRERGLMHRNRLGADRGMIFIFDGDRPLSFWMKNTKIPLSIAYVDSQGRVKSIKDMEPFSLAAVESDFPVQYAIEANRGFFTTVGLKPGDLLALPELPAARN